MTDDELLAAALGNPGAEPGAISGSEIAPRRQRHGGRATGERSRLPQQRPWAQPRIRVRPTEVVSADELESIHLGSLRVLEEIGMDFLDDGAREVLRGAGARVEEGTQ
ncbi:MAG: trimethylamine---corrinoid protein Co-methyltransferase, partial [Chloroflexota bacterium]|nr:trimethylamine---corrinoid protein Co-methyltransferase [Chloroflexota bacterium]